MVDRRPRYLRAGIAREGPGETRSVREAETGRAAQSFLRKGLEDTVRRILIRKNLRNVLSLSVETLSAKKGTKTAVGALSLSNDKAY
jgi:hypothetical protein